MWDDVYYPFVWLTIAVVLGIIEATSMGIIMVWFAIGAIIAFFSAILGASLSVQIIIFIMVSGILLYKTRPIVKAYLGNKKQLTNADSHVGQQAVVTEGIDNVEGVGTVKIGGKLWSARSELGDNIPVGSLVSVVRITGVRMYCIPVEHE
jgi:membrane protein implicated in regulation of membrane protease activity